MGMIRDYEYMYMHVTGVTVNNGHDEVIVIIHSSSILMIEITALTSANSKENRNMNRETLTEV